MSQVLSHKELIHIAEEFGTPVYIYHTEKIAEQYQKLKDAFAHISGAYDLVEKFINIFYDPASFNLAEMSSMSESGYQGYETAFSLVHYLLACDFFNNY